MKLSELKRGEQGVIARIYGKGSFRRRIVEMGFINGERITVIQSAPMMDPVQYEVMGYRVSLRRDEAQLIEVIGPAEEAAAVPHAELHGLPDNEANRRRIKSGHTISVALVGNPNCGKTSLFNAASGGHERVGNYAGVTVDSKEGSFDFEGYHIRFVDLPGTYSLTSYSPEERYVRNYILTEEPDVVLNVLDASNLKRNLLLTTQLIDMDLQMVCALNMSDELERQGDKLDRELLSELLGAPIIPTVGRNGSGLEALLHEVIRVYEGKSRCRHIHVNHGELLEREIKLIQSEIKKEHSPALLKYSSRFLAIKWLEGDKTLEELLGGMMETAPLHRLREKAQHTIERSLHQSAEEALTNAKYSFVQGALRETLRQHPGSRHPHTDRLDQWTTNRWLSYPIFLLLLFIVFEATFVLGDYPMQGIEWLVAQLSAIVSSSMPDGELKELVTDGIIGGVGSVIVFLPNILILYFMIALLEESGYMARAVFIMDKMMHKIGLHGKSFIPLVMGFGCNVPAILSTRTIESKKGRLITMLIIPFMSCSARLPLFLIILGSCFPRYAGLLLFALYLGGILTGALSARLLSRFVVKEPDAPFVMELPPYRLPALGSVLKHTWEKGVQYLKKMGGTILVASILVWFLGYYPRSGEGEGAGQQIENSYMGRIGHAIEPLMSPMGFDWKQDVGLLAGVGAKELVVSTMGVIYAGDGEDEEALSAQIASKFTTPSALAYVVFVLLYFPCLATLVAIKNESGRWRWALFAALYTTATAWLCSWAVYSIASLFA